MEFGVFTAEVFPPLYFVRDARVMNTREKGRVAESLVCEFLEKKGHTILYRNFSVPEAEVDIVSSSGGTICFTEVKQVPVNWSAEDFSFKINSTKKKKIRFAASVYLARNSDIKYDEIRFDAAFVIDSDIKYIEGAF